MDRDVCYLVVIVLLVLPLYMKLYGRTARTEAGELLEHLLPADRHFVTTDTQGNLGTYSMKQLDDWIVSLHGSNRNYINARLGVGLNKSSNNTVIKVIQDHYNGNRNYINARLGGGLNKSSDRTVIKSIQDHYNSVRNETTEKLKQKAGFNTSFEAQIKAPKNSNRPSKYLRGEGGGNNYDNKPANWRDHPENLRIKFFDSSPGW